MVLSCSSSHHQSIIACQDQKARWAVGILAASCIKVFNLIGRCWRAILNYLERRGTGVNSWCLAPIQLVTEASLQVLTLLLSCVQLLLTGWIKGGGVICDCEKCKGNSVSRSKIGFGAGFFRRCLRQLLSLYPPCLLGLFASYGLRRRIDRRDKSPGFSKPLRASWKRSEVHP